MWAFSSFGSTLPRSHLRPLSPTLCLLASKVEISNSAQTALLCNCAVYAMLEKANGILIHSWSLAPDLKPVGLLCLLGGRTFPHANHLQDSQPSRGRLPRPDVPDSRASCITCDVLAAVQRHTMGPEDKL